VTAQELQEFIQLNFRTASMKRVAVEEVRPRYVRFRYTSGKKDLRPGGTISGPAIITISDTAMYLAMVATDGPGAGGFTTSLNADFLRKPKAGILRIEARILKQGRHLLVGRVEVRGDAADEPVAVATLTYSLAEPVE
jgi:uncharacterized protein (TIGR00369 family)